MFENIKVNFEQTKQIKRSKKNKWTEEETEYLKNLVSIYGTSNWPIISNCFPNRDFRQVREHYKNNLVENIDKSALKDEEIQKMIELVSQFGTKWSVIRQYFPNRSDSFLKNQWNSIKRRNFSFSLSTSPSVSQLQSQSRSHSLQSQNDNKNIPFDDSIFDITDFNFFDPF
jgi:hypothetical protein